MSEYKLTTMFFKKCSCALWFKDLQLQTASAIYIYFVLLILVVISTNRHAKHKKKINVRNSCLAKLDFRDVCISGKQDDHELCYKFKIQYSKSINT